MSLIGSLDSLEERECLTNSSGQVTNDDVSIILSNTGADSQKTSPSFNNRKTSTKTKEIGSLIVPPSIRSGHASSQHLHETDSIGSATSIINELTLSRNSRPSYSSFGQYSIDPDDEILVGDERDLHDACKTGDVEIVENLGKSGVDINCRNKHDRTPMLWASGNGHLEVLQVLLDEGAAIDLTDKFGMDALLWSAWFGHQSCLEHLLRVGANVNARNKHGYTWLHCAVQNNHFKLVEMLGESMQDFDKNTVDDIGRTALHTACKHGRTLIARKLLQLGCNCKLKDKSGNTVLHIAAKYGFHELIPLFTDIDVDIPNNAHKTALHIAAEEGNSQVCEELLALGADVNAETEEEMCPLHFAAKDSHMNCAQVLIDHKGDVDAGNKHNQTPLHFAVSNSNVALIQILLKARANPSVPDARNETVLHIAAENGQSAISEILLLARSSTTIIDHKGKSPLDVASRGNYITIVDMIIKAERYWNFIQSLSSDEGHGIDLSKEIHFKPDNEPSTQHFRLLLFQLASKNLKPIEWKQLAFYWGFTDKQLAALEEQYTGKKSYKEHGHRMLLIWLHGCTYGGEKNPVKGLYEGLVGIQKTDLAEQMRLKASQIQQNKGCTVS